MNDFTENKRSLIVVFDIFLFSLTAYLLTASGVDSSDVSQSRINVLSSLTNNFDLTMPMGSGIKGVDGKDYSWFGIGPVILTLPLYLFGKLSGSDSGALVSFINQLIGAAINVLVFIFARSIGNSIRNSTIISLMYGFSSMAWYYSKDPGDHNIETFFLLLAIYFMYRYTLEEKNSYLLYSAFALGFCLITRPNTIIAFPALMFLLGYDRLNKKLDFKTFLKDITKFTIGLIPFTVLFMWYNIYRFGSIIETGHHFMAIQTGLNFFTGTDIFTGLSGLLFSPSKGFFYYSPVAVLFFISIHSFLKSDKKLALCFITLMCSYFIFYAKNIYWHGDWAWGPRYLLATLPYFIIPAVALLNKSTKFIKLIILSTCILGVTVQLIAISIHPYRYFIHLQQHENVIFTVAKGSDVQPIIEPPPDTYFDWKKSPLLYQLRFIVESYKNIFDDNYKDDIEKKTGSSLTTDPTMKVYDFWWSYKYFIENSYKPLIAAAILLFVLLYCGRNLYIHAFRSLGCQINR